MEKWDDEGALENLRTQMPKAYSDDLRIKLLEAYDAGDGSLAALAGRFHVSVGYAEKIRGHLLRTGSKVRTPQSRHGQASRVDAAAREELLRLVREQPDRTLTELRDLLRGVGVHVCRARVCQVLGAMGLRRKKNAARA